MLIVKYMELDRGGRGVYRKSHQHIREKANISRQLWKTTQLA